MHSEKSRLGVVFGNRGFFPASLIHSAREEMSRTLKEDGHEMIVMDVAATPNGAIETPADARKFEAFYNDNRNRIDGIIVCLPNFGDENGMEKALKHVRVPILVQAYPDELDKLLPAQRRDAFCGKLSIMDVLLQSRIKFTNLMPHTAHPDSDEFRRNLREFDRTCRVVKSLNRLVVGAIGARTTPFKTVRVDEIALQNHGITVETVDMADVFARMDRVSPDGESFGARKQRLTELANWGDAPPESLDNLVRLYVVLDELIQELELNTLAIRCWTELQLKYRISPCLVTGDLAENGIPAACEVDVSNAVAMQALGAASGQATSILDWNNNYGSDPNKCILFHCGNVPSSLMAERGTISDHSILSNSIGAGHGFGCNQGRIRPMEFTYSSMATLGGKIHVYLGTGRITEDEIPKGYFGCAGVAEIADLQKLLHWIGKNGHRHHVSITPGHHVDAMREAFEGYLGYETTVF